MNNFYKCSLEIILVILIVVISFISIFSILNFFRFIMETKTVCINNVIYEKKENYYLPLYIGEKTQYCINKSSS